MSADENTAVLAASLYCVLGLVVLCLILFGCAWCQATEEEEENEQAFPVLENELIVIASSTVPVAQ